MSVVHRSQEIDVVASGNYSSAKRQGPRPAQHCEHLPRALCTKCARCLIENEQRRPTQHRACESETLLLASRKLQGPVRLGLQAAALQCRKAHRLQSRAHLGVCEALRCVGIGHCLPERALRNVGALGQEERALRQEDLAASAGPDACKRPQEAALAGALWCAEQHKLSGLYYEAGLLPQRTPTRLARQPHREAMHGGCSSRRPRSWSQQVLDSRSLLLALLHRPSKVVKPVGSGTEAG
mmetsp:Transcript_67746/g.144976  ORF Transcript_67746/g.144976 Transcript_67746/m.144976 type:complete len:239 (-) Transcript_67746:1648-2364(-)